MILILAGVTSGVESVFSYLDFIKTKRRSSMEEDRTEEFTACSYEKEMLSTITNEEIIERFYLIKERKIRK